jgi:glycosyltransferase involved in cell wall biosynthesis
VRARREWVAGKYDWRRIAEQTLAVYREAVR